MEGHRFLVCCVLVLTIYELGGATATVKYTLNPLTESIKKDKETELSIELVLSPQDDFEDDSIDFNFTAKPLNDALIFKSSEIKVSVSKTVLTDEKSKAKPKAEIFREIKYIISDQELEVSVVGGTDEVLTGDLNATLSCDHDLCKDSNSNVVETEVVIVKETKTLYVTATPSYDVSQTSPTANVTVTLSKDLATLENITISVLLQDPQGQDYSNEGVLASVAESSFPVVFTNIQWGEYQLIIGCVLDSVCSALSQWIQFPNPVSVAAHPSYSNLSAIIFGLKEQLADCSTSTVATKAPVTTPSIPTTIPPSADATTMATDATAGSSSQTTLYMEFAVGGLIAALVCGLLGYLLYHYRTKVKEWICSKKVVVSNLPIARKLRRNAGSRYSKLPRTMQEALHQD